MKKSLATLAILAACSCFAQSDLLEEAPTLKVEKIKEIPAEESHTYFTAGTNIALIIPCPEIGVLHQRRLANHVAELEAGVILPYVTIVPYAGFNYIYVPDGKNFGFGIGAQVRAVKKHYVDYWLISSKRWACDVSPTLQFVKYTAEDRIFKIQYFVPFNLRLSYGWGF